MWQQSSDPLTSLMGSEIGGCNLPHGFACIAGREMSAVPVDSAMEVIVKKAGFFGQAGKHRMLAEDAMQPTGSGPRRADKEERWQQRGATGYRLSSVQGAMIAHRAGLLDGQTSESRCSQPRSSASLRWGKFSAGC